MKTLLFFTLFLASSLGSSAQQPIAPPDNVWVEGRVIEAATGLPQTSCEVQFLQEGEAKAVAFCDENGYYSIGWMPSGLYTLSVLSGGTSLYYAEFLLSESAMINIALMPDTVNLHALPSTEVTASRHKLGSKLITSPNDPRLWNFSNVEALMDSGPASEDRSWPTTDGRNPFLSSMLLTPPIWILCNEPWNPSPKKKETKKDSSEESKKDTANGNNTPLRSSK